MKLSWKQLAVVLAIGIIALAVINRRFGEWLNNGVKYFTERF